eukprot:SAG31_NODE_4455_length_3217_cov_2.383579_2_plen_125_part_00
MVAKRAGMGGVKAAIPRDNRAASAFLSSCKYTIDAMSPTRVDPTAEEVRCHIARRQTRRKHLLKLAALRGKCRANTVTRFFPRCGTRNAKPHWPSVVKAKRHASLQSAPALRVIPCRFFPTVSD